MRYLVRMITPPDGIVLDPFLGSGTTGMAAKLEQKEFIGCEMNPEYAQIAELRIAAIAPLFVEEALPVVSAVRAEQSGFDF